MSARISRKEFLLSLAALGFGTSRLKAVPLFRKSFLPDPLKTDGLIVIKEGDSQYGELHNGFNKRISNKPAGIVICQSTNDVVQAVQYAKKNSLSLSCRSGGHHFEGYSSVSNSLVLDFSLMSSVVFQGNNGIIAGPGCRLSKLYDSILPRGRLIPAGSCGSVGLGGLALGGGYGFFSRKFGLTCDSLIDATVVDTEGVIHSAKSESDLLWALRGGGTGGLGIVTDMTFETHPAPPSFTSHHFKSRKLNAESASELMETWFSVCSTLPRDAFSAFVLNGRTLNILITEFEHTGKGVDNALQTLGKHMGQARHGKPLPLARALKQYYGHSSPLYFKNASAGLYNGFDDIRKVLPQILDIVFSTSGMIYQINTLGGEIQNPKFEQSSAFPHRRFGFLSELQTYWDAPHQEEHLVKKFNEVQDIIRGHGIIAQYANYPSAEFKDWELAYYGTNYERLRAMKRRLDPANILRHPQSIRG